MSRSFTIMTVCTGNICRSPAMDRLLAHHLRQEPQVQVISSGTFAHSGEDMQRPMRRRIAAYGADPEDFMAEQITDEMIHRSDLILAATGEHVADMIAAVPQAAPKIFRIRSFGRILQTLSPQDLPDGDVVERLTALQQLVDRGRDTVDSTEEDVLDPYLLPEEAYEESFQQISSPVGEFVRVMDLS